MFVPRAVCATCKVPMEPNKNGVSVEMLTQSRPYYKIRADEWICRSCGIRILIGMQIGGGIEHWDDRYESLPVDVQVDL